MTMLAMIFVKRHAGIGYPSVGLESLGTLPRSEMQFGGDAATTQNKIEGHGLLKTIGAQEKMAGRGTKEPCDVRGFRQTRWDRVRDGRFHEAIEQILPAAKADDAETGPRGGKTNGRFKDDGSIGTTELRETPACGDSAHESSMDEPRTRERARSLAKTVLQAAAELTVRRTTNYAGYSGTVRAFKRFVRADDGDGRDSADGNCCEMGVCED